jgi:hypothetical protein
MTPLAAQLVDVLLCYPEQLRQITRFKRSLSFLQPADEVRRSGALWCVSVSLVIFSAHQLLDNF